jgi:hypothetical protein
LPCLAFPSLPFPSLSCLVPAILGWTSSLPWVNRQVTTYGRLYWFHG